ncbi:MAG: Holliday junction resolvase RuvX [Rhodospirillaceae bacterium]
MPERQPTPTPSSPALPASVTVLAFDFGEKRIGVAVGETAIESARPLELIAAEDNKSRFAVIERLIAEWQPKLLVVGLPAYADGTEHELTRLARRFAHRLEGRFRLPVALVDERYTSVAAESALRERGITGRGLKDVLDAESAAEILRSYYSYCRAQSRGA